MVPSYGNFSVSMKCMSTEITMHQCLHNKTTPHHPLTSLYLVMIELKVPQGSPHPSQSNESMREKKNLAHRLLADFCEKMQLFRYCCRADFELVGVGSVQSKETGLSVQMQMVHVAPS